MGADPAAEEQFGPYLVYERLGVGGMATVHRALERGIEGFERMVALKRLLPHLAEDASFIKSFVREAKLASLLNHVNIVQIFELGRVAAEYFISMEYIDGKDIRRILRHARKVTGPPPINITVGILLQLCEALDYAHTKCDDEGHPLMLVHRDVSPSNLLLTSAGHLKVIDFGIAKAQSSQLRTQTGRVKGKLAYMAPEAVNGKDLDSRSDLWAVGVIAHELLTARPLFASKNEYQTLLKVQRGDIMPPSTFNQAVPPELDAIVARALARDPDERYAGASDMRDALQELRRKKGLQTGYREIATWIDWAFSVEMPSGGFAAQNTGFDQTGSASKHHRTPTPRPKREDDEAVEIAWGGGEQGSADPLLLDDVPDVSEKHLGAAPQVDNLAGHIDGLDDIPASLPSHGPHTGAHQVAERRSGQIASVTPLPRRAGTTAGIGGIGRSGQLFDNEPKTNPTRRDTETTTNPEAQAVPDVTVDDEISDAIEVDVEVTPLPRQLAETVPIKTPRGIAIPAEARIDDAATEKNPPLQRSGLDRDSSRIPRTKPGVGTSPRHRQRSPMSLPAEAPVQPVRSSRGSSVPFGASIVERDLRPRRTWLLVVCIGVLGGAALALTLYITRDLSVEVTPGPGPKTPLKSIGTLKVLTEPADAEIRIEGVAAHKGTPWAIELEAGTHQIEVHRDGYKAWLSSIDLSPNETQTVRVALGPLGEKAAAADAMLLLAASSPGLEAVVDGKVLEVRTPIKMPIKPGPHTVMLRKDGVDIWKTSISAQAATDYTFDPSFTEAKRIERERHVATVPHPQPVEPAEPAKDKPPEPVKEPEPAKPDPKIEPPKPEPKPEPIAPPPPPKPDPIVPPPPKPTPVVPVAPPVQAAGPALVAPSAVTKLSGETPHLGVARNIDMPPVVSAKLCIDTDGKVASAYAITKIEHHAAEDLADVLKTWRYAPYKIKGVATAACFAVSFRVK